MTVQTMRPCSSVQSDGARGRAKGGAAIGLLVTLAGSLGLAATAVAQEAPRVSAMGVLKQVAFDPTTYAPAVLEYDATMRDWNTSQIFFARGFREHNERFTVSGRPNDHPVTYEEGRRLILRDVLVTLQTSAVNNVSGRIIERFLSGHYPHHRRMVKTVGWIERVAVASYLSYRLSAAHYRQARDNDRRATALGFQ